MDLPGVADLGLSRRVYKYTAPEYAENIVKFGDIWLGTLHDYRREEQLGNSVGDRGEGSLARTLSVDSYTSQGNHPDDQFIRRNLRNIIGGVDLDNVTINNMNFRENINHSDCYIYSTTISRKYDKRKRKSFGSSCVLIHNPGLFFGAITVAIQEEIRLYSAWHAVIYNSREGHYRNLPLSSISFIKPRVYQWQGEVRVVWFPKLNMLPIRPHLIRVPEITSACSICA